MAKDRMTTTRQVFRFRLYPGPEQEKRILRILETCRRLWNDALSHRKSRWEKERASTSYSTQQWNLTGERKRDPDARAVLPGRPGRPAQAGQRLPVVLRPHVEVPEVQAVPGGRLLHLPAGIQRQRLPRRRAGSTSPRWATYRSSSTARSQRAGGRRVPRRGEKRAGNGTRSWCTRRTNQPQNGKSIFESPVGIDVGLNSLITTTDGLKVEPPEFLRKSEKRLKRLQRRLSRKKKGLGTGRRQGTWSQSSTQRSGGRGRTSTTS